VNRQHSRIVFMAACVADVDIIFSSCGFFFFLLLILFSSPNLSRRTLDVYHISTHDVSGLSANLEWRSEMCCTRLAKNTGCTESLFGHHRTTVSGYVFVTKARIDNRGKTC